MGFIFQLSDRKCTTTSQLHLGCSLSYNNLVNISLMLICSRLFFEHLQFWEGSVFYSFSYSLFGIMAGGNAVPAPVEQPAVVLIIFEHQFGNIESGQGLCSTPSPLLSTWLETWLMVMLLQLFLLSSLLWSLLFLSTLAAKSQANRICVLLLLL